jgi:hypothetical protein
MLQWATLHPWMTLFIALAALQTVAVIYSRTMRAINIANRGWPPEHLDADGDFKQEKDNA